MKIKKFISLIILVMILILELLPYGAICNFKAGPEKGLIRETYSYFDLTPFGYANFGPFLTAVLTCIMLVFAVLCLLKPLPKIRSIWKVLSVIAIVASLAPIMFGLHFYSVVGGAISILLVAEYAVLFAVRKCTALQIIVEKFTIMLYNMCTKNFPVRL